MTTTLQKFEQQLAQLGVLITRYPIWFIVVIVIGVAALASNLPKITVDTSTEGFLHETDPARVAYDAFRNQFGRDEKVLVAIKTDDVFSLASLTRIKALHDELEANVPHLFDISSIINARNTVGDADNNLLVDDLMKAWPTTDAEALAIRNTAMSNPLFKNILINEAGTFTVIVLESNTYSEVALTNKQLSSEELLDAELGGFDEPVVPLESAESRPFITDKENAEMVAAIAEIVESYQSQGFELHVAGSPAVTAFLKKTLQADMKKFVMLIIIAIVILLTLLFRRASGVVLPLLTVCLAVISTMGLMAITETPIKVMTQVLPSFLLAVGVGASIHILAIFFKHFDENGDKAEAIKYTLMHSGLAVIMTSLTTAAGMASFAPSEVATVADLGIFSAAGVLIALVFTLVLLPALLMVFNIKRRPVDSDSEHHDLLDKWLKRISDFSQDYAKKIVIISVAFMAVMVGFATKIGYSHNPLVWFPKTHETRIATEVIDQEMRGSISLELVIDTGVENGLYDLNMLRAIESISNELNQIETAEYFVGKAISVVDVILEIHKGLNANDPAFYALPTDSNLISQEILLFENSGSEDLEDFVDSRFSKARITVKVPWIDAFLYHDLLDKTATLLETHMGEGSALTVEQQARLKITTTGMIPLLSKTISAAISSSGLSYLIASFIIALMLMLLLSSVKLGLLSMIPNMFPIFVVLAIMVLFNFPLDLFTMLIGIIVLGIAVDDIVHFMHNFRRYHLQGMSTREAVTKTLTGTGRAMTITTIVLFVGFMLYMFASMSNLFLFGLLTAIAFMVALLAVFLLAPALMALVYPDEAGLNKKNKD